MAEVVIEAGWERQQILARRTGRDVYIGSRDDIWIERGNMTVRCGATEGCDACIHILDATSGLGWVGCYCLSSAA